MYKVMNMLLVICFIGLLLISCVDNHKAVETTVTEDTKSEMLMNELADKSETDNSIYVKHLDKPSEETLYVNQEDDLHPQIVIDDTEFNYGDELEFYYDDEKRSTELSAIIVVTEFLEAQKSNNFDIWSSFLTKDKRLWFSEEQNSDFGMISLEILSVNYEEDLGYKKTILASQGAIDMGLTADNVAVIRAKYEATYDHSKVPIDDGIVELHYVLIRNNNESPWYIQDWGYGYGGM